MRGCGRPEIESMIGTIRTPVKCQTKICRHLHVNASSVSGVDGTPQSPQRKKTNSIERFYRLPFNPIIVGMKWQENEE